MSTARHRLVPILARWALVAVFLGVFGILAGCSPPAAPDDPAAPTSNAEVAEAKAEMKKRRAKRPAVAEPSVAADAKPRPPKEGEQVCFVCLAKGQVPCTALGCNTGYRPCPGPCFKRHEGTWVPYPGQVGVMARAVRTPDRRTYYVPEGHAGEVWVFENGALVSKGPCPTCKGHRVIQCKSCHATGKQECPVCTGEGAVPAAWTPEDNPWFNRQPDLVRLTDGRVFLATDSGGDDAVVLWKTRAGEIITVPRSEVAQWPKPQ
ncbi:MAG: hypothetical protein KIT22_00640 [Verrucomicrobiae bacterium]|nr:hypothetical protein [Verrucomicrobiae bacterium]